MPLYNFISFLGLLTEFIGTFCVLHSFIRTSPIRHKENLDSIHGNRIREKDIDKNIFLNSLVCQSIEAQDGFLAIMLGVIIQGVCILCLSKLTYFISFKTAWIIFIIAAIGIYTLIKKINNKRLKNSRDKLLRG